MWLLACTSPDPIPATANRETWAEMTADLAAPRSAADGGGTLTARSAPARVEAGAPIALEVELEVGPEGIAVGGVISVIPSPFWGWTPPQTSAPGAPGYTTLSAPDGVQLALEDFGGLVLATVRGRALAPGERVAIGYGVGNTARADRFAERSPALWVAVDGDGDGVRSVIPHPIEVEVVPRPAAQLVVTLPSTAEPGAVVELRIAAVDAVGNGPAPLDPPTVTVTAPGLEAPVEVALVDGLAVVPVRAAAEGVYRAAVDGAVSGRSNPMVVRAGVVPILWADLQIHSAASDGTGDVAGLYRYAREVAGLDVAAVTDHDHWGMVALDRAPDRVAAAMAATDAADDPGRFVAVPGYEWTSWLHGHRHVLWFDHPGPWASSLDPATDTPAELHALLAGRDVVVIRHHPAGGPVAVDWSFPVDPVLEPVVEIASVHGQSGSPGLPGPIYDPAPGAWVEQQLADGAWFGLVGSTDGHDGHPGLAQLAGGSGGLCALEGASPTRGSVLETLRARRVYATNGPRIVLRVDAGGATMGSTLPGGAGPVPLDVRVVGTAPIERIELVRRSGVVGSAPGAGAVAHAAFEVDPIPGDRVWVRVIQVDGGLAWSSPIAFEP